MQNNFRKQTFSKNKTKKIHKKKLKTNSHI